MPVKTALFTMVNTDPKCFWLTNFLETLLVQAQGCLADKAWAIPGHVRCLLRFTSFRRSKGRKFSDCHSHNPRFGQFYKGSEEKTISRGPLKKGSPICFLGYLLNHTVFFFRDRLVSGDHGDWPDNCAGLLFLRIPSKRQGTPSYDSETPCQHPAGQRARANFSHRRSKCRVTPKSKEIKAKLEVSTQHLHTG